MTTPRPHRPFPSLLHLDSSANHSDESITRRLTASFAETWRRAHDGAAQYHHRDLAVEPVAPLDTAYAQLGRRVEREGLVELDDVAALAATPAERQAWQATYPLIAELRAATTVLIGAPMYNYSVSALLKAWIDRVTFPGAFIDPGTTGSVLADTTVVVVCARGGAYGPGTPNADCDFQTPYLRAWLERIGVRREYVRFVTTEMTIADVVPHLERFRPHRQASLVAAAEAVDALAVELAATRRSAGTSVGGAR